MDKIIPIKPGVDTTTVIEAQTFKRDPDQGVFEPVTQLVG